MQTDRSKIESTGQGTGGPSYHSDGVPEISASERSGFSGTFQSTLSDWIQLVQMGRRDAVVNVRTYDGKVGTLWCRDGDIIDAACDGFTGEDAVIRALAWQGGSVSVEFESISRRRLIQTGTSGLLLRAAYIHDVQEQDASLESPAAAGADAGTVDTAPPAAPRLNRRPLDLRFVAAGGLSALLLFGGFAWRWMYAHSPAGNDAARLAVLPQSPPPEHLASRPPETPHPLAAVSAGTTGATATVSKPLRASLGITARAASASWPASLLWSRPAPTSVPPARRHTVAAAAKRSGATSSSLSSSATLSPTWAAAGPGEGRKASASAGSKPEIVRESPARVQVIEARPPRVQIIEEREPRIEEIK